MDRHTHTLSILYIDCIFVFVFTKNIYTKYIAYNSLGNLICSLGDRFISLILLHIRPELEMVYVDSMASQCWVRRENTMPEVMALPPGQG